jgi:hypothetical protein
LSEFSRALDDALNPKCPFPFPSPTINPAAPALLSFQGRAGTALGTIGLLERVLIYGFILQGQYGAIGFVTAAKAFTRFKALDDRSFAEYVLVGTLLSGGLALLFGLLVVRGLAR